MGNVESQPGGASASTPGDSIVERAQELVGMLTITERASLCSGSDAWTTTPIAHVGIPAVTVADGPHGVRKPAGGTEALGLSTSLPATCFPTASALAATWDRDLLREVGQAIADECRAQGVDVLLGPGVNLKRSPLCGRNFEYLSEDPFLTGELGTAYVTGVQARGIGTSLKHLAANNQEFRRMTIDVVADERSLRELELAGFERVVRRAQPWTVMGSYNRLNGTFACEHPWLLSDVLREQWGFDGVVLTDWGATNDRVAGLFAGCDLQMPGPAPDADTRIAMEIEAGDLDAAVLEETAVRLVSLALRAEATRTDIANGAAVDVDDRVTTHHALARRVAADGVVLCRNVGDVLPLRDDEQVALLGELADRPRFQGTGSSRVNPTRVDTLRAELTAALGEERVTYQPGYHDPDRVDDARVEAALAAAREADVAVVCVGLPDAYENEGADRADLRLPPSHDHLVAALAGQHDRVVVVLANGAPVAMPWLDDVAAVVEGYLGGQAAGGALADVLTGAVNPSGHLAETFPRNLDDVPAQRQFPGGPNTVEYREGLYVGYRFHDTVDGDVLFPFGHGLSYTTFDIGDVALDRAELAADELEHGVTVTIEVTNTGTRAGKVVPQVYVRDVEAAVHRPDRELKGFVKVALEPGETARVDVPLEQRALAYWHPHRGDWVVEPGRFEVLVGLSSRDLRGSAELTVQGDPLPPHEEPQVYQRPPRYLDVDLGSFAALLGRTPPANPGFLRPYDRNTPIGATATSPAGKAFVKTVEARVRRQFEDRPENQPLIRSMVEEAPLRTLLMGGMREEELEGVIELLNGRFLPGGDRLLRQLWERYRPG